MVNSDMSSFPASTSNFRGKWNAPMCHIPPDTVEEDKIYDLYCSPISEVDKDVLASFLQSSHVVHLHLVYSYNWPLYNAESCSQPVLCLDGSLYTLYTIKPICNPRCRCGFLFNVNLTDSCIQIITSFFLFFLTLVEILSTYHLATKDLGLYSHWE